MSVVLAEGTITVHGCGASTNSTISVSIVIIAGIAMSIVVIASTAAGVAWQASGASPVFSLGTAWDVVTVSIIVPGAFRAVAVTLTINVEAVSALITVVDGLA